MIKVGFDGMDERFAKVDARLDRLEGDVAGMKADIRHIKNDAGDIKLTLAHRVSTLDFQNLEERVDELEAQHPHAAPSPVGA